MLVTTLAEQLGFPGFFTVDMKWIVDSFKEKALLYFMDKTLNSFFIVAKRSIHLNSLFRLTKMACINLK